MNRIALDRIPVGLALVGAPFALAAIGVIYYRIFGVELLELTGIYNLIIGVGTVLMLPALGALAFYLSNHKMVKLIGILYVVLWISVLICVVIILSNK